LECFIRLFHWDKGRIRQAKQISDFLPLSVVPKDHGSKDQTVGLIRITVTDFPFGYNQGMGVVVASAWILVMVKLGEAQISENQQNFGF